MTYCHSSCHIVNTHLSTVPAHHSKVDSVEDEGDTQLHDGVRVEGEKQTNACEDQQQDDIANDASHIGGLIDEEKPPVD